MKSIGPKISDRHYQMLADLTEFFEGQRPAIERAIEDAYQYYIDKIHMDKDTLQVALAAIQAQTQQFDCELGELHDNDIWDGSEVEQLVTAIACGKRHATILHRAIYNAS